MKAINKIIPKPRESSDVLLGIIKLSSSPQKGKKKSWSSSIEGGGTRPIPFPPSPRFGTGKKRGEKKEEGPSSPLLLTHPILLPNYRGADKGGSAGEKRVPFPSIPVFSHQMSELRRKRKKERGRR